MLEALDWDIRDDFAWLSMRTYGERIGKRVELFKGATNLGAQERERETESSLSQELVNKHSGGSCKHIIKSGQSVMSSPRGLFCVVPPTCASSSPLLDSSGWLNLQ
ncbi:hypothetical protein PVK06_023621 [Gossypium arboreum]|uniref:Uncharacterized protein n=1 Tax=Gossypium arboreum TaxID=29729 RepID=A0ABR0PBV0_GOSAR|nr:hypothetical protein PVK06_023621 [Gossypium arboreum]